MQLNSIITKLNLTINYLNLWFVFYDANIFKFLKLHGAAVNGYESKLKS
jgi:hypothetical protein